MMWNRRQGLEKERWSAACFVDNVCIFFLYKSSTVINLISEVLDSSERYRFQ